ncbi:hypothetical protein D3C80_1695520 [compost metagenome]
MWEIFAVDHQYRRGEVVTQRSNRRQIKTHQFIPHLDPVANLQIGAKVLPCQINRVDTDVHQQFNAIIPLDTHRVH